MKMNRRMFTKSILTASAISMTGLGIGSGTRFMDDRQLKHKIVSSFPDQTVTGSKNAMGFFMNTNFSSDNDFAITINNFAIDQEKEIILDDIFSKEIHEITYEYGKPEISYIVKAANRIARQTRRGNGNHYAEFSDHVLVWYKGSSKYDAPMINMGKNIFKHPRQNDYFVKINGLKLNDNHREQLRSLGYKRII